MEEYEMISQSSSSPEEISERIDVSNMEKVTELTAEEARNFFLKAESYVNFDLPIYFKFQGILDSVSKVLNGNPVTDFRSTSPRNHDDINYTLLTNKDGKYAWRPFELIHPAIYVSLVNQITEKANWSIIIDRFQLFGANEKIECHSIPVTLVSENKDDKDAQIFNWWQMIEQRSIPNTKWFAEV